MDITQDPIAGPYSAQKGKGIEADAKNWRAGWWDLYPILERPKRSVVWSQTSVIFSADATQPIITGRHFSSSKQFVLPSPTPIMSSLASYDPPSIIVVSPGDTHLLAYFPRRDGEGTACLWERGPQIDNWDVKECWSCGKGKGIVTASWLEVPREWIIAAGRLTRLHARGPTIPVGDLALLLVTEDNYVHVTYFRRHSHGLRSIRRSLQFPGFSREQASSPDYGEIPNYVRQCTDAAIGLGYNEGIVFIASHSRRPPPSSAPTGPAKAFHNLGIPLGEDSLSYISPEQRHNEWENWGDERLIEIFELHIRFDGAQLVLLASRIAQFECQTQYLTSLAFVSTVPSRPSSSDAAASSQPKANAPDKGRMGLVAAFVNFHDYTRPPSSSLNFYGIHPRPQQGNGRNPFTMATQASTRVIDQGVVTFIESFTDLMGPLIYACVIDVSAISNVAKSSPNQVSIGTIRVLNLPAFNDNPNWIPSEIKLPIDKLGSDLPLYGASSPNRRFFCALTSSLSNEPTTIHPLPSPNSDSMTARITMAFCCVILSKISPTDIVQSLCTPDFSLADIVDIMNQVLTFLENFNNSNALYIPDIMGIATEVYRQKAESSKVDSEIEMANGRWQAALDICSLSAVIRAFDDCRDNHDPSKYDLEIVWQLIALSTWVIEFTEKIMKACVVASNATLNSEEQSDVDLLTLPVLLHVSHPYTLGNLIAALTHVRALRTFLGSLPAGSENAKMAQTLLLDTVDCSGVDLEGLTPLLKQHLEVVQEMKPEECRKALATCQPTISMLSVIHKLVQDISKSETLLNKSALFIKPHHLVEGMARLSTAPQQKSNEKDIITKNSIPKETIQRDTCLRCGGKTAIDRTSHPHRGHYHSKWHAFELIWQVHCVCGGQWLSSLGI